MAPGSGEKISPPPTRSGQRLSHDQDASTKLLFFYYNKNDKIRVTDLQSGIVWGTNTDLT